jgi:predicted nucleotidyltransferase component of viral defense system
MDKFNTLPNDDRKAVFQETATQRGVLPIIIEKDFWVCWTLKQLYTAEGVGQYLTFKGGTSLSKAYGLIERFSEDIDLTISKDAPFLVDGDNPMGDDISGKERERRIKSLKANARSFVAEIALPILEQRIKGLLGDGDWKLALDEKDNDQQTILFYYPFIFGDGHWDTSSWDEAEWDSGGYVRAVIRLEFGARGEIEPSESKSIIPYAAEAYPQLFDAPATDVQTLSAERTFWEKVTILHALHHGTKMRDRMSRHYYDTYIMAQKGIADTALQNLALLKKVVKNKSLLFKDNKASYDTAIIGTLRLLPDDTKMAELKRDYAAMNEMFMGETPAFSAMIEALKTLESRINSSS